MNNCVDILYKYKDTLKELQNIDKMMEKLTREQWQITDFKDKSHLDTLIEMKIKNYFYSYQDIDEDVRMFQYEHGYELSEKNRIAPITSLKSLEWLIDDYDTILYNLSFLDKTHQEYYLKIQKELKSLLQEVKDRNKIDLPEKKDSLIQYTVPNSWYLTPSGYLYNDFGPRGHQTARLLSIWQYIEEKFRNGQTIHPGNYKIYADEIEKRGYVDNFEFQDYTNLIYTLPTEVLTVEKEKRIEFLENYRKNLKNMPVRLAVHGYGNRSYQRKIVNLYVGFLHAHEDLLKAFKKLNQSKRKEEIIKKIFDLKTYDAILIQFCGFSKLASEEVESKIGKTIVTSLPYGIEEFQEYLENGFNLQIVPKLVYDKYLDDVTFVENSYILEKYYEKVLENYHGKGRIYIKK